MYRKRKDAKKESQEEEFRFSVTPLCPMMVENLAGGSIEVGSAESIAVI
jgi:hypothetical protein